MHKRHFELPREGSLGLRRITNAAGLDFSVLPNGCIFALEHEQDGRRTMFSQVLGSPLGSGIMRILLRIGGAEPRVIEAMGPRAKVEFRSEPGSLHLGRQNGGAPPSRHPLASSFANPLAVAFGRSEQWR